MISAVVVPEDRLNLVRATGLVIAFCGVAWVFTAHTECPLAPNPALGNALVLTAATLLAIRMVYTRQLAPYALDHFDPIGTTEQYSTVIGIWCDQTKSCRRIVLPWNSPIAPPPPWARSA